MVNKCKVSFLPKTRDGVRSLQNKQKHLTRLLIYFTRGCALELHMMTKTSIFASSCRWFRTAFSETLGIDPKGIDHKIDCRLYFVCCNAWTKRSKFSYQETSTCPSSAREELNLWKGLYQCHKETRMWNFRNLTYYLKFSLDLQFKVLSQQRNFGFKISMFSAYF